MNDLMIFEGNEVEIILNEKGEPFNWYGIRIYK